MELNLLYGKKVALLVWNKDNKKGTHVYLGEIIKEAGRYQFINQSKSWKMDLDENILSGIKIVSEEIKEVFLNADLYLTCFIADIPDRISSALKLIK
jgi:hypothetical protein